MLSVYAEKIQSRYGDQHADPEQRSDLPAEEQTGYRNKHHVHGCNKSSLAGPRVPETLLLKDYGHCQKNTAADTAPEQIYECLLSLLGGEILSSEKAANKQERQQRKCADKGSCGIEGKSADEGSAVALHHDGGTPDESRDKRQDHLFYIPSAHSTAPFPKSLFQSISSAVPPVQLDIVIQPLLELFITIG